MIVYLILCAAVCGYLAGQESMTRYSTTFDWLLVPLFGPLIAGGIWAPIHFVFVVAGWYLP